MNIRPITADEVVFTVSVEQDDLPVRGNAIASGYDDLDRQVEDDIIARLNAGNVWAWALVTVTATWRDFSATSNLGACSYDEESDFRTSGYFANMCAETLASLNDDIARVGKEILPFVR